MADLTLPQEPTWKLLAVSPDMMDTSFCNKRFPFRWRSSLAVSAFEPQVENVPTDLCEGRITFLKITATITGYQPSREETEAGYATFPNVPTEELSRIIDQYFGCYGALLSVAVFPNPRGRTDLPDFPHIIDVEPKTRDLIQAATESGEILTTSKSNVKTNKSLTHTESTETGYELSASGGVKDKFNVAGKVNHKNTEQEQENWSVATDASRERQEKEGSSTQISQLYNLLSSYHIATNRAQFLMLARPHVLQPTDHRTFVDGLRQIEGVQEFVVIIGRPADMPGLCVEVMLETGHFPEGLTPELPKEEYEESEETFKVTAFADDGFTSGDCTNINQTHTVLNGWIVDTRPERGPDPGHPGMKEIANNSNGQANSSLENYNYQRISDADVLVSGRICGESLWRDEARFNRDYVVFTRSVNPKPNTGGAKVPMDKLLITSRGLCVCFKSGDPCPEVQQVGITGRPGDIVAEHPVAISPRLLTRSATSESRLPAMKELLFRIQKAMVTSWRLPRRHSFDEALGFLETEYFKDQIKKVLPRDRLEAEIGNIPDVPRAVVDSLGKKARVADVLDLDLAELSRRTGLSQNEAVRARNTLLGIRPPSITEQ